MGLGFSCNVDVRIDHAVFYKTREGWPPGEGAIQLNGCNRVVIRNSMFVENRGTAIWLWPGNNEAPAHKPDNDHWLETSNNLAWKNAGGNYDGWAPEPPLQQPFLEADPMFVNPASGDFHVRPGSPALLVASDGSDLGSVLPEIASDLVQPALSKAAGPAPVGPAERRRQGRKLALVIGVQDYSAPIKRLKYSRNDAQEVAAQLRGAGYDVRLLTDATRPPASVPEVRKALIALTHAGIDDSVLIYFSVHGSGEANPFNKGRGFLLLTDAQQDSIASTALPLQDIESTVDQITSERVVLILDSCFSGSASAAGIKSITRVTGTVPGCEGSGGLLVEDDAGRSVGLDPESLAGLFEIFKDTIRCVVLNACYSELQAAEIRRHIDCVVGMAGAIDDRAAIAFSSSFYQALGFGASLDTAFRLGKNEIALLNLPDHDAPMLVTRPGVDASHIALRPSSWWRHMWAVMRSRRARWSIATIAAVAAAALALRAWRQPEPKTWGFWRVQLDLPGERFERGALLDIKVRTDHDGYIWVFSPEGTQPMLAWPHPDDERLALNTIEANQWRPIPLQGRDHYGIAAASQGSASQATEELILIVTAEHDREAALRHLAAMRPDLDVKAIALASGGWGATTKTYEVLRP